MTDKDNILVERFFSEAPKTELPDNGFSNRVMNSLPSQTEKLARTWTIFCTFVSVILFFAFDVWQIILINTEVFLRTLLTSQLSPSFIFNMFIVFAGIVSAIAYAAISRERLTL